MVCSLDGFIDRPDGDVSWMQSTDQYQSGKVLTDQDIVDYLNKIDCYVMGSKTYELALRLGWPYGDKPVYVVTDRAFQDPKTSVTFLSGDLSRIVNHHLRTKYQNIWMVGGAKLTKSFLQAGLADEIILSIVPVILGGGTPFFDFVDKEIKLHLKDLTAFQDGMVELTYEIMK